MLLLDLGRQDYDKEIMPFLRNGIIIDTSIIFKIIQGHILTRVTKKKSEEMPDYKNILDFFDLIKIQNRWEKFFITPHILTEVCRHFRETYDKWNNYRELVLEIMPILENMKEEVVIKDDFMKKIDHKNPVIEAGDISIYVTAENFSSKNRKVALLADDSGITDRYINHPQVLVLNYQSVILNSL
ncbi:MAG: Uncharacterized protein CEO19_269 [Parcubacteria group bacterium Gr01-1014_73]|nr:MAG: Uncharacterized protein CEO19_269 [Parcubacteria group bacterium Gr01-1014_73]